MKRLIFCLALFSLTFMSAIASDVGNQTNDMLQNSYVVQQISVTPVINAVNFETTQVVYNLAGTVLLTNPEMVAQTFKMETWRNPDYGPSIIFSNNMNIKNQTAIHNYSYTPYIVHFNYKLQTINYKLSSTVRHV